MLDQYIFSAAQVLPNNTSAYSTDWVDLGALTEVYSADAGTATALAQFGPSDGKIWLVAAIATAPTGTSLKVALRDCATTAGSYLATDIASPVITVAGGYLAAGKVVLAVPLPRRLYRFLKLYYTAVGNCSDGAINAHLAYGAMTLNDALFRV